MLCLPFFIVRPTPDTMGPATPSSSPARCVAPDSLLLWWGFFTGISFLLPNHDLPWLAFQEEACAALAIAPLIVWVVTRPTLRIPALAGVPAALGVVCVLQWLAGLVLFRGDALMGLLYWWGAALAVVVGANLMTVAGTPTDGRPMQNARLQASGQDALLFQWIGIILACIVSLAICIHQWLDLQLLGLFVADLRPRSRPYGNLAQPNQLSTLFFLGLTGVAYLFEARKLSGFGASLAALVMVAGVVITQSRAGILIAAALVLLFYVVRARCHLKVSVWMPLVLVALYAAGSYFWPLINHWLLISDHAIRAIDRVQPGQRAIYWRSMLDAIMDQPMAGFGFNQINMAQRATALDYPATFGFFESSHNLMLDMLVWFGVPIAILAMIGLGLWLFLVLKRMYSGQTWVLTAAIVVLLTHSMVEFPFYYAYYLLPAGVWAGALSSLTGFGGGFRFAPKMSIYSLRLMALVVIVLSALVGEEYLRWEEDWRTAAFEAQKYTNTPPAFERKYVLLDQIQDTLWFSRFEIKRNTSESEMKRARRIASRESGSMVMFKYAQLAAVNGYTDEAIRYLKLYQSLHSKVAGESARRDWLRAGMQWKEISEIPFPSL